MGKIKISTIVSISNKTQFLKQCVDSILIACKNYKFECILIDNSSIDENEEICLQYQKQNKDITYIKVDDISKNIKNIGLQIANGEYIYFINANDILHKNFIDDAIKYLDNNSNVNIFIRNYIERIFTDSHPMYSMFEINKIGPIESMCVFRKKIINITFDSDICDNIIFTGKLVSLNSYFFDSKSTDSFTNNLLENPRPLQNFNIDWLKYSQSEIKKYSKTFDLSYHIIDKCNKDCIACGHFSPLADKGDEGVSLEQFNKDMESVKYLIPNINSFIITGGEPTLHKDLLKIIEIAANMFKHVNVCSNGLNVQFFIDNKDFFNNLNNVTVYVTHYNLESFNKIKQHINRLDSYVIPKLEDKEGKRILFNIKHLSSIPVNADKKYNCIRGMCTQLRDGKIYLCQYTANFHVFSSYFNMIKFPFSEKNTFIDLYENPSPEKVLNFIFNASPDFCNYCNEPLYQHNINLKTANLTNSKKEINEWYE